jgi:hypothetical protein
MINPREKKKKPAAQHQWDEETQFPPNSVPNVPETHSFARLTQPNRLNAEGRKKTSSQSFKVLPSLEKEKKRTL